MNQARYFTLVKRFIFTFSLLATLIVSSQTTVNFEPRYQNTINGELTMIGNSILGEHVTNPYTGTSLNNSIDMVYIDVDSDASTFNSSSSNLNLPSCSRVVYAGLYWGATSSPATTTVAPISTREQVRFRVPGGSYVDITADTSNPALREELDRIYYKDVTSLINISSPNGDYFVGNVNVTEARGISAGWTLVIVYEDPAAPRRYISTFDGFSAVRNSPNNVVDFNYSGFTTPPSGPVEGKLGVAAMEGDLGLYGDHFQLRADANIDPFDPDANFTNLYDDNEPGPGDSDPTDGVNNADNFFNSSVTDGGAVVSTRNPASTNTLGWDQHIVDLTPLNTGNTLIGNNETGLTARVTNDVGGDHIFTFLNTLSINVIEPALQVLTTVEDNSGNPITASTPVALGEDVWYELEFQNIGTDNATNTEIINRLPFNVTLNPSSIVLPAGVTHSLSTITESVDIGGGNTANVQRTVITFDIDDPLVVRASDPTNTTHTIRYMVTTSALCDDYTDNCINELVNDLISNYDGEQSGQNISGQPGLNGINGCGIGSVGAMISFVDISSCLVGSTETVCNDTTLLSADTGYNAWRWYKDGVLIPGATSETLTITPQNAQTVYRCEQIKVGCTVRDKFITVLGLDVDYTPFDNTCKDSADGGITIKVNEVSATYRFELFQGGTSLSDTGVVTTDTHTFNGLDIGTYSVRITKAEGCFNVHTFQVNEPTLLTATSSVVDNIMPCNGNALVGRIEVTGNGGTIFTGTPDGNEYEYSMDGGAFQTSNIFETAVQGNHTITVRDANGCTTTTVANIDFDEEITYDINKEDVVCLNGNNANINVNITQNNAGNTITYSIDGTNFQSTPSFSGLTVGDYEITIRKQKGGNTCDITENISIVQLVDLQFTAESSFACEGGVNTIIATVADEYKANTRYRLNGGSENTTGIFEDVPAGTHTVTVFTTTSQFGTSFTCSAEPIEITIAPYTLLDVTDAVVTLEDVNTYVIEYSGGEADHLHAIKYLGTEEVINPDPSTIEESEFVVENEFQISQTGYYMFAVKDARGCVQFVTKYLKFKDIEIPNFFTPDNGDGVNDTWYPKFIEKYPNLNVMIFDRYQRLITEINGNTPDKFWDGKYKGKLLPSGDYWYVVKLNNADDSRTFKGHFTLYR